MGKGKEMQAGYEGCNKGCRAGKAQGLSEQQKPEQKPEGDREFTSHSRWGGTFQALGTAHAKVRKGSACLA